MRLSLEGAEVPGRPQHQTSQPQSLNEGFSKLGAHVWGPRNKDYSILGSILGSRYVGKLRNLANRQM